MSRFKFLPAPLDGLFIVERLPIADTRGFLARLYCAQEFAAIGCSRAIAQINHTMTRRRGAVRGMHFQFPPYAETKLVTCVHGEVFDVAVDLRQGSATFLQWHGEVLTASNQRSLLIPEGFAHGFQTLTEDCELVYLHTEAYHAEAEGALNACDPRLAINWPLPISEMSERDRVHQYIGRDFRGIQP